VEGLIPIAALAQQELLAALGDRTEMARPHCTSAPEARSDGTDAAREAAGRSHLWAWPAQSAPLVDTY
jgi:hypothetical protein